MAGMIENRDPTDTRLDPDRGLKTPAFEQPTSQDFLEPADGAAGPGEEGAMFSDGEVLTFLTEAKRLSRNYQQMATLQQWESAHSYYRSVHPSGSKYSKPQYQNRAKYFKPKTRAAVRKNLTATANAFFARNDVLAISAEDDSNPLQSANAALLSEVINHRLRNKTNRTGLPWFQTVLGARHDAQIQGVCCSKQSWIYRYVDRTSTTKQDQPINHPATGTPLIDAETGEPMMQSVDVPQTTRDVEIDRPDVTLFPPEMALLDPGTPWIKPAQASPTLIVQWPMHIDAIKTMMNADQERTNIKWRKVSDQQLAAGFYSEHELMGLRASRDGTVTTATHSTASIGGNRNEIVEARENFWRIGGVDYHAWSIKGLTLLSDPVPTREAYPEFHGIRPYVFGTDILEPHVLYPQSHVSSWKSSQDEINDLANLSMDATRQSTFPTAKVKAGRNIDYKSVQRRDGQGIILVTDMSDVEWDRPPGVGAGVYQERNLVSNDFDEVAGIFSQGSVQSNRQLNDTVGGMQIMSANASATSEFDLRCFVETWAEEVISHLVMLEQYYEDDATLLAICGKKAKLFQKFGVDQITDELLESQVTVELAIGLGSADPMQKLAKFKTIMDIAQPFIVAAVKEQKGEVNYGEILGEIFGQGGYRGGERFFKLKDEGQPQTVPVAEVQKLGEAMKAMEAENASLKAAQNDKSQAAMLNMITTLKKAEHESDAAWHGRLMDFLQATTVAEINNQQANQAQMIDGIIETALHFSAPGDTGEPDEGNSDDQAVDGVDLQSVINMLMQHGNGAPVGPPPAPDGQQQQLPPPDAGGAPMAPAPDMMG